MARQLSLLILIVLFVITGCSVNPVTGENEFSLVSSADELNIGNQQYAPTQQSQGGKYILDPELTAYLQNVDYKLAKVSDRPDLSYKFVILNNSVPNAWALPGGKIAFNRSLLKQKMPDQKGTEADLEKSKSLLPTAAAANALGKAAFAQSNSDKALGYFNQSAQAGGTISAESRVMMQKIELPKKPNKYVPAKMGFSKDGKLLVVVDNRASVAVTNPVVLIQSYNGQWQNVKKVTIKQTIQSGKRSQAVNTGIGPMSAEQANNYRAGTIKVP